MTPMLQYVFPYNFYFFFFFSHPFPSNQFTFKVHCLFGAFTHDALIQVDKRLNMLPTFSYVVRESERAKGSYVVVNKMYEDCLKKSMRDNGGI